MHRFSVAHNNKTTRAESHLVGLGLVGPIEPQERDKDISPMINILLMTATITPENSPELARTDPKQRLGDYEEALRFYLGFIGKDLHGIVFAENSDSDVGSLRQIADASGYGPMVEIIANYGAHSFPGRDRSVGEFALLDYAMANSKMIAGADALIWKITGRYKVLNLHEMIQQAPREADLYCDLRNRPIPWADLRFWACTKQGYSKVLNGVSERLMADPREPAMRLYIPSMMSAAKIVARFRTEPLVDGVRGWDNRHYSKRGALVKYYMRKTARAVVPWLWI